MVPNEDALYRDVWGSIGDLSLILADYLVSVFISFSKKKILSPDPTTNSETRLFLTEITNNSTKKSCKTCYNIIGQKIRKKFELVVASGEQYNRKECFSIYVTTVESRFKKDFRSDQKLS